MKVFISWSKNSCEFAGKLNEVIKELFDAVGTFYSPEIPAGEQWLNEIEEALTDTDFGIICVTRENQLEQWLNYEAGALSRQVGDRRKRLGVLLLDFDSPNDVTGPFKNFQMKLATRNDFRSLMKSVNELGPNINQDTLDRRITATWPLLEEALASMPVTELSPANTERDWKEKIDELLTLVRAFDKAANAPVITPFVVSADERQRGREFKAKVYNIMRGRDIHVEFRALTATTNVLDVSIAVSAQERQAIEGYYDVFFPGGVKKLVIMDAAWKDQFLAADEDGLEADLAPDRVGD